MEELYMSNLKVKGLKALGLAGLLVIVMSMLSSPVFAAVLWDQPLSSTDQNAYASQSFTDYSDYTCYSADDFSNSQHWSITQIFVPGNGWNGFSSLSNASTLNFAIYGDNSGLPGASPVWSISLNPSDPQISITTGSDGFPSNVTLTLSTALELSAGNWWLAFYPEMSYSGAGQYGRQPSDTANGNNAQWINPGGAFGYGTAWQNWNVLGGTQHDTAFRLEGTEGGNTNVPEPATMLLLGIGLAGLAGARKIK